MAPCPLAVQMYNVVGYVDPQTPSVPRNWGGGCNNDTTVFINFDFWTYVLIQTFLANMSPSPFNEPLVNVSMLELHTRTSSLSMVSLPSHLGAVSLLKTAREKHGLSMEDYAILPTESSSTECFTWKPHSLYYKSVTFFIHHVNDGCWSLRSL